MPKKTIKTNKPINLRLNPTVPKIDRTGINISGKLKPDVSLLHPGTSDPQDLLNTNLDIAARLKGGFFAGTNRFNLSGGYNLKSPGLRFSREGIRTTQPSLGYDVTGSATLGKNRNVTLTGGITGDVGNKPSYSAGLTYRFGKGGIIQHD